MGRLRVEQDPRHLAVQERRAGRERDRLADALVGEVIAHERPQLEAEQPRPPVRGRVWCHQIERTASTAEGRQYVMPGM
jgi:hypothetical protein